MPVELRSVGWFLRGREDAPEYRPVFEVLLLNRKCDCCSESDLVERSLAECIEQHVVPAAETVLDAFRSSPLCDVISNDAPLIGAVEQELPPVPSDLSAIRFRVVATQENTARVHHTGG